MRTPHGRWFIGLLPRAPVALFGLMLAASSVHASCGGVVSDGVRDTDDAGALDADETAADASTLASPVVREPGVGGRSDVDASDDSGEDRADGMSYGDAYLR